MTDKNKLALLSEIEVQVCGILIENKICEYIDPPKIKGLSKSHNNFTNMRILEPFASKLGYKELSPQMISELRSIYPTGSDRKGTSKTVRVKLTRWLQEFPQYSYKDVCDVLRAYVEDKAYSGEPMFNLDNIFYKKEYGSNIEKSPFEAIAEKYGDDIYRSNNLNIEDDEGI